MLMELDEMITTAEAVEMAKEYGTPVSRASILRALQRGQGGIETGILGGVQLGSENSQWLMPRENFIEWLNTRQPRGPKSQN